MHERTYEDGTKIQEFFKAGELESLVKKDTGFPPFKSRPSRAMDILREEMNRKHREAMADNRVVGVRTVMIDEAALCPCGSGKPFSACCVSKVVTLE